MYWWGFSCRPFRRLARQRAAYHARHAVVGPLWQGGYYERVLRREEKTETVVRYILDNPVRAGLVDRAEEYPYSWCRWGRRDVCGVATCVTGRELTSRPTTT